MAAREITMGARTGSTRSRPRRIERLEPRWALTRYYVNAAAAPGLGGLSWDEPFHDLQIALAALLPGDEVWVAKGTYRPSDGDRTVSFDIRDRIKLYGGFAGHETDIDQRDIVLNETILSGEIGDPDDVDDNSYHVVTAASETFDTEINGFTISGGTANGPASGDPTHNHGFGGGVRNHGILTIVNCRIYDNRAVQGGGVYSNNDLLISDSQVANNLATSGGGGIYNEGSIYGPGALFVRRTLLFGNRTLTEHGGGIYTSTTTSLEQSQLVNNVAHLRRGGGVYSEHELFVTATTFDGNHALDDDGGGAFVRGFADVAQSAFRNNFAGGFGGGLANAGTLQLTNSTVEFNTAGNGGGLLTSLAATVFASTFNNNSVPGLGGAIYSRDGLAIVANSTLSTNQAGLGGGAVYKQDGTLSVSFSTIVGNSVVAANGAGGGLRITPMPNYLSGSIVAGNTRLVSGRPLPDDIVGEVLPASSFNFIGAGGGLIGLTHGEQGNQVGTVDQPLAAELGPLANNGGPTRTHLPVLGSPVIDAGDPDFSAGSGSPPVLFDQRGLARVLDGDGDTVERIDIGSTEAPTVVLPSLTCDLNRDSRVGLADLGILQRNFGATGAEATPQKGDVNLDGEIGRADLALCMSNFGRTMPPSPPPGAPAAVVAQAPVVSMHTVVEATSRRDMPHDRHMLAATRQVKVAANASVLWKTFTPPSESAAGAPRTISAARRTVRPMLSPKSVDQTLTDVEPM